MRTILAAGRPNTFPVEVEMFRNSDEYRQHLEGLSYEELLGQVFAGTRAGVYLGGLASRLTPLSAG